MHPTNNVPSKYSPILITENFGLVWGVLAWEIGQQVVGFLHQWSVTHTKDYGMYSVNRLLLQVCDNEKSRYTHTRTITTITMRVVQLTTTAHK